MRGVKRIGLTIDAKRVGACLETKEGRFLAETALSGKISLNILSQLKMLEKGERGYERSIVWKRLYKIV